MRHEFYCKEYKNDYITLSTCKSEDNLYAELEIVAESEDIKNVLLDADSLERFIVACQHILENMRGQ